MNGMVNQISTTKNRTYSEVIAIPTFIERFIYLQLSGQVGMETFGYDRYLNQILYHTAEWRRFRRNIIIRDNGCDLACAGHNIIGQKILVHHINPITVDDILNRAKKVFNPDNVICVTLNTHNAIHYGDKNLLDTGPIERKPNDTCPWKK